MFNSLIVVFKGVRMEWQAKQYSVFDEQRSRPAYDLVNAIPEINAQSIIDLGCGTGNSTQALLSRYSAHNIMGLDNSETMLIEAKKRLPQIDFQLADISQWESEKKYDVIFSNAALQWLPDHISLYTRLVNNLTEGGYLAVQTPDNLQEPPHKIALEIAATEKWINKIGHIHHEERHSVEWYFSLLKPLVTDINIWRTTYFHFMNDINDIVEWFKGTALRPFLSMLDQDEQIVFLKEYKSRLSQEYAELPIGGLLLPFPRVFILAKK
nr:methyltransferase domain-containing protein [Providencia burhodogranariea]